MTAGPILFSSRLGDDGPQWTHLNADHPETRDWLTDHLEEVDPIVADALLAEETRPRIVEINGDALIILRGLNFNENAEPEDMISVRVLAGEKRIISTQKRQLRAIRDIQERTCTGTGPATTGDFLVLLIFLLIDRMEPTLAELDRETDDVEERVMEDPDSSVRMDIIDIRKRAIIFRRYMTPQRDAIGYLRNLELAWLSRHQRHHLLESHDRITRYVEYLDAVRERAQIVKDELSNALADRLNRNTYLLGVVAAIFLPLGFLTGLLGINVGGIPGTENPAAFWIFSALLGVLAVGLVLIFRRLKWL